MFINLYKIINDNRGNFKKETAFEGIRKYYEHIKSSKEDLKDFQKLVLDSVDHEKDAEEQARNYNEIYNSMEFILSYLNQNNDNEIILEIMNANLRKCVKNILFECEDILDNNQYRFLSKENSKKTDKPLKKLSVDGLNKAVCEKYVEAIQYIIETFFYEYYGTNTSECFNNKKDFYENKIRQYPRRRPLNEIQSSGIPSKKLNKLWEDYMIKKPCRFKSSNSYDWKEYCRQNNIEFKNEQVEIEAYKEKKIKDESYEKITDEMDQTFFNILSKNLLQKANGRPTMLAENTVKNHEINIEYIKLKNYINQIITMIKECKKDNRFYSREMIKTLIDSNEFGTVANNLILFEYKDMKINSIILDTWKDYFIKIQNKVVDDNFIDSMENDLNIKVKEYVQALQKISNDDLYDISKMSESDFILRINKLQSKINFYINYTFKNMCECDLFGYKINLENYHILNFPFQKTYLKINKEVDLFKSSDLQWTFEPIDILKDKDDYFQNDEKYAEFSYSDNKFSDKIKIKMFKTRISNAVYYFVKKCEKCQQVYLEAINEMDEHEDVRLLMKIFTDILELT